MKSKLSTVIAAVALLGLMAISTNTYADQSCGDCSKAKCCEVTKNCSDSEKCCKTKACCDPKSGCCDDGKCCDDGACCDDKNAPTSILAFIMSFLR